MKWNYLMKSNYKCKMICIFDWNCAPTKLLWFYKTSYSVYKQWSESVWCFFSYLWLIIYRFCVFNSFIFLYLAEFYYFMLLCSLLISQLESTVPSYLLLNILTAGVRLRAQFSPLSCELASRRTPWVLKKTILYIYIYKMKGIPSWNSTRNANT